ncbi:MAG: HXXEE domain-containing protein [Clostridia bacterium]|nr:HXXEE domain-containing protein [Clostridia bacterium]
MDFYVWLFPLIFIFHDMEEIVGFIPWLNKNRQFLESKYSKMIKLYDGVTTEGFSAAVFEELIVCIIICIISYLTNFYGIWFGGLLGCVLHFCIHIIESLVIRKYIPALITSIICLPIGIIILYESAGILSYPVYMMILYGLAGVLLVVLNLKLAHMIMKKVQKEI